MVAIGNERCLSRIVDERSEQVWELDLGGRTKRSGDARRDAAHAILDLLHGVIAECPERTSDHSRLRNDVVSVSGPNGCHADYCRVRRLDVARNDRLQRGRNVTSGQHRINPLFWTGTV